MKFLNFLLGFLSFCSMNHVHGLEKRIAEIKEVGKILGFVIGSTTAYGILNNQVLIKICKEYFDEEPDNDVKKKLLSTKSSILRAAIWGILKYPGVGAFLISPMVISSRLGSWPKLNFKDLIKPFIALFATSGLLSFLCGLKTYLDLRNVETKDLNSAVAVPQSQLKKWYACNIAELGNLLSLTFIGTAVMFYNLLKRYNLNKLQSASS